MLQYHSWCVHFVQTCKAKQGFGYVELDDIRALTPTRQNWDQTQLKELKSDITVNIDVFNQRFLTPFPRVALDYDDDLSIYCQQESFVLVYVVLRHVRIVFKIHICFMLDRNLQTFVFHVGTLHYQSNYVL